MYELTEVYLQIDRIHISMEATAVQSFKGTLLLPGWHRRESGSNADVALQVNGQGVDDIPSWRLVGYNTHSD